MKIEEEVIVGAPTNTTTGIEGPKAPIKVKPQNLFKRVMDIKKKKMFEAEAEVTLNKQ